MWKYLENVKLKFKAICKKLSHIKAFYSRYYLITYTGNDILFFLSYFFLMVMQLIIEK